MAVDGDRMVLVGIVDDDAAVWTSVDGGRHWSREPDPSGALGGYGQQSGHGVVLDGDRVLVFGQDGPNLALWEGTLPLRSP